MPSAPHQNNGLNTAIEIADMNGIRLRDLIVCDSDSSIPGAIELLYRAANAWIFGCASLAHQQKCRSFLFTLTCTLDDNHIKLTVV